MPATGKSSLPFPRNYEEETSVLRAERKAAFIRETAVRFATARDNLMYSKVVDDAEMLAKELEDRGYL